MEPDLSGRIIDRYRLLRRLSVGGMGAVYEAVHTALEKRVAVKLLRTELTRQSVARKRFLREAKVATRVEHLNVVSILDFGETPDGCAFFVMELLEGRDLEEVLREVSRLPWGRARKILLQVASAVGAAHAHGIIHRDMKPANCFMVEEEGRQSADFVKVLDFGIAKHSGGSGARETERLTSTDEIFGTAAYMAPEVAYGTTNDHRSDIYSVGVMMFRMLVGTLPFQGSTAFQIIAKHVSEPPPRPCDLVPSIPDGVEAIVLKALAKNPADRFQSMTEFAEALERFDVDDLGGGTVVYCRSSPLAKQEVTTVLPDVSKTPQKAELPSDSARTAVGWASIRPSGTVTLTVPSSYAPMAPAALGTSLHPSHLLKWQSGVLESGSSARTNRDPSSSADASQRHVVTMVLLAVLGGLVFLGAIALGVIFAQERGARTHSNARTAAGWLDRSDGGLATK